MYYTNDCLVGQNVVCPSTGGRPYCQTQTTQTQPIQQQQNTQTTPTAHQTQTIGNLAQGVMSASQIYAQKKSAYDSCMAEVDTLEVSAEAYKASHPIIAQCDLNMSSCLRGENATLYNQVNIELTRIYNNITSKANICSLWVGGSAQKLSDYSSSNINYQIYYQSGGSYKAYNQNDSSDTWTFYPQTNGWNVYGSGSQHYEVYCSTGLCSVYGQ